MNDELGRYLTWLVVIVVLGLPWALGAWQLVSWTLRGAGL